MKKPWSIAIREATQAARERRMPRAARAERTKKEKIGDWVFLGLFASIWLVILWRVFYALLSVDSLLRAFTVLISGVATITVVRLLAPASKRETRKRKELARLIGRFLLRLFFCAFGSAFFALFLGVPFGGVMEKGQQAAAPIAVFVGFLLYYLHELWMDIKNRNL
jgi:putative flippase GtrA